MLSRKKTDKRLGSYIKEHLRGGYSRHAIKKVLVDHGYDEGYVRGLIRRHYQQNFAKIYSISALLLLLFSFFALNPAQSGQPQQITGYAAGGEGCCTSICRQTSSAECHGNFIAGQKCPSLEECNVGCCIDKEGYCLTNYLKGNCLASRGTNLNRDCRDIVFCRNITDKSYGARRYSIVNRAAGFSSTKANAGYYKSSFNIQYYLYDKLNVISVFAQIKDNGKIVGQIALYDDGSHNDGSKNDNLYGNNWLSSAIQDFDGFKQLDVGIIIKYADDTQQFINSTQGITVLNDNKCVPTFTQWNPDKKRSIIFAAQNYEPYGFQKFETDAENFISALFSIDRLKNSKDELNVFRLEQSLSYFNAATLASIASSSCPHYSNKKDLIIILDANEQYCNAESTGIIRISPQALFYQNMTNFEFNETFANFCSYALTSKKLADEIIAFAAPPTITINTFTNLTFAPGSMNLSFSISAMNYPVNYSVSVENAKILGNIAGTETTDSVILNLTNGTNFVLIRAVDKNRNKAFAPLLINATTQ